MYQLEVKASLVQLAFNPGNGWRVTVHVDPMERARAGLHPADKAKRAQEAFDTKVSIRASANWCLSYALGALTFDTDSQSLQASPWRLQLRKIPVEVREKLNLEWYTVGVGSFIHYSSRQEVLDRRKPEGVKKSVTSRWKCVWIRGKSFPHSNTTKSALSDLQGAQSVRELSSPQPIHTRLYISANNATGCMTVTPG